MDNKYIACKIGLFDLKQKVNICINNTIEKTVESTFDDLPKTLYELCKEYNINEIKLNGNISYCMKLKNILVTDYEKDIPINITFCN